MMAYVQASSQEEIHKWSELCDASQQQLAEANAELARSQQELTSLREHVEELRNYQLSMQAAFQ